MLKDKKNSGFGLSAGDQRDLNEMQQGHAVLAFSGYFSQCQYFWTIRPTTHKKCGHPDKPTCWCGDRKQVKTARSPENHFCVSPQSGMLHFKGFFYNVDWHFYGFIFLSIHLRQVQRVLFILTYYKSHTIASATQTTIILKFSRK